MSRDYKAYLKDILDSIKKIEKYTNGIFFDKFSSDELVQDGVVRNLEIIGEAVKNISMSFREKYSNIPWKKIAGMRDKLIHRYFNVDVDRVWSVIVKDIPNLKKQIEEIIKREDNNKIN